MYKNLNIRLPMKTKNKFLLQRFATLFHYKGQFVFLFDKMIIAFARKLQES